MSELTAKSSRGIEVDYPPSFPVARMPDDILHLIMEHYVEARLDELETNIEEGPYESKAPRWPVLPLLTTCKAICNALIPKLYRYTLLLGDQNVRRFLIWLPAACYRHVRILDIHKLDYEYLDYVAPQVMRFHCKPHDKRFVSRESLTCTAAPPRIDTLRLREKAFQCPIGFVAW